MALSHAQKVEAAHAYQQHGSIRAAARALGLSASTFQNRLAVAQGERVEDSKGWTYPRAHALQIMDGAVLIGGDAHFWPGDNPKIWQTFVAVARELRPKAIILNGDMIDGTRISRHGRLRGQKAPRVIDELACARERISELPSCPTFWTMGNHDQRIDIYLANQAPEMDDLAHTMSSLFPEIQAVLSVVINESVEARHCFRGGIHAAWNNTLHSGRTCVTNHTHQLGSRAMDDRNGRRWGIETGMLNEPNAPQFEYTEGAPVRWNPGFALLTFDSEGALLPPELCETTNGISYFRGQQWA